MKYGVYNRHMHTSMILTKGSAEYRLVLRYLETQDMESVQKTKDFDQYVEEICAFLYGNDDADESIKKMRRSICTKRAIDNILKKAKNGRMQIMTQLNIHDYLCLEEKHGRRGVAGAVRDVVQQKVREAKSA